MDRIITNTGGQPIILADLIFIQDNIEQELAILKVKL